MRNIDRNQRNLRPSDLIPNHRRDLLLYLELNVQVDLAANELLGILNRSGGVVAVVENEQIDATSFLA